MANSDFKILILGANGMVGHAVFSYLSEKFPNQVFGTNSKKSSKNQFKFKFTKSSKKLERIILDLENATFVINCIGELKNGDSNKMQVNYLLPRALEKLVEKNNFYLIHISTDDVFGAMSGKVNEKSKTNPENKYAKSKLKGETKSKRSLTIRTSFLGFDKNKKGLLEWVKNNKSKTIDGFENQIWSGCTTLQFAQLCEYLILKDNFSKLRKKTNVIHFSPLGPLSKYSILISTIKILKLKMKVNKTSSNQPITRFLTSVYLTPEFLKKFDDNIDLSVDEMYKFEDK